MGKQQPAQLPRALSDKPSRKTSAVLLFSAVLGYCLLCLCTEPARTTKNQVRPLATLQLSSKVIQTIWLQSWYIFEVLDPCHGTLQPNIFMRISNKLLHIYEAWIWPHLCKMISLTPWYKALCLGALCGLEELTVSMADCPDSFCQVHDSQQSASKRGSSKN